MSIYVLRNLLLLLFLASTCLYLIFLHLNISFQDEFSCSVKEGLLQVEPRVPPLIPCKLVVFSVFQLLSLSLGGVYVLLVPVVVYNALQLCQWDKGLLSVYEMLPAFDLLSRKMLTCPVNDLNVILLFLRANISCLTSFGRLNAVGALRQTTTGQRDIDTVVDFMTLLAGLETAKPRHAEAEGSAALSNGGALGRLHRDLSAPLRSPPGLRGAAGAAPPAAQAWVGVAIGTESRELALESSAWGFGAGLGVPPSSPTPTAHPPPPRAGWEAPFLAPNPIRGLRLSTKPPRSSCF